MGRNRRKFAIGFKQQVVDEVESGLFRKNSAARRYEISAAVIDRWIMKARAGILVEKPTTEEKALRAENEKLKAKVGELTMLVDVLKKTNGGSCMKKNKVDYLFLTKKERRKHLACLPVEEKVRILVQMQKLSAPIFASRGLIRKPWSCDLI